MLVSIRSKLLRICGPIGTDSNDAVDVLMMTTTGQSNFIQRCIAAEHESFSRIQQMAPMCTVTRFFAGPTQVWLQTASGPVYRFLQGSPVCPTHTHGLNACQLYSSCVRCGCTLALPGQWDWTICARRRCGHVSNYFEHLLTVSDDPVMAATQCCCHWR